MKNDYFKNTTKKMWKDMNKMFQDINKFSDEQDIQALVLSRYDSILSLLQITQLHIHKLNNQKSCATTDDAAEAVNEATAEKETILI